MRTVAIICTEERENHHYYNETQTFTLTLRNPQSHATTRQGRLKTPAQQNSCMDTKKY